MAQNQTYTFNNEIDTVEISSIGARIIVLPREESGIYVEYSNPNDAPEFCAVLTNKTLSLKEQFSFSIFGNKPSENYTLKVYLPTVCYAKLKVSTASGGADIGEVNAKAFELNTASGDIHINAFFEDVKLQSASGNITLSNPTKNIAASLRTCTVSGSTTVIGYKAEKFSIHSVSGKTSYNSASGAGEISVTSGNIDVTYADWSGDLSISAISGSVSVFLPEAAGMELKFDGLSGCMKTDLGSSKGSFLNLGKGTTGEFGGENKHKVNVSLTSGSVTIAQQ